MFHGEINQGKFSPSLQYDLVHGRTAKQNVSAHVDLKVNEETDAWAGKGVKNMWPICKQIPADTSRYKQKKHRRGQGHKKPYTHKDLGDREPYLAQINNRILTQTHLKPTPALEPKQLRSSLVQRRYFLTYTSVG